jgi:SAM-dependent methyltransferase
MYRDLASWWPIISAAGDYAEEARAHRRILLAHCARRPRTLLELGCGGGTNASHLKAHFQMTLVDLSPGMLANSRALNPECEHVRGDMRTLRLGRLFDAVFTHDAILYMTTEADLSKAIATAYAHCRPGGAALFVPDHVKETFVAYTRHGGHDGRGRAMRYLDWIWDPNPRDTTYLCDFGYLLRDARGNVRAVHDRHELGLFPKATWMKLLKKAGFRPKAIPVRNPDLDPGSSLVFVGVRA